MSIVEAFLTKDSLNIKQTNIKREWMNKSHDLHAYKCLPLTLGNSIGYELSCSEDIVFIWDGVDDTSRFHIKILQGEKYCHTARGNATISFRTGIFFKTTQDISMLHMPVPNLFRDTFQGFTSIMSTSFYNEEFPCVIKVTKPNTEITIKAGEPIITVMPISMGQLADTDLVIKSIELDNGYYDRLQKKEKVINKIISNGEFTNFYRDGVEFDGSKLGDHEVKSLKLRIKDER